MKTYIADWSTGEPYKTCGNEEEAIRWIKDHCTDEDGKPWEEGQKAFYDGHRIELY